MLRYHNMGQTGIVNRCTDMHEQVQEFWERMRTVNVYPDVQEFGKGVSDTFFLEDFNA